MKIYISVDIEGVTGVVDWKETIQNEREYAWARKQMTREALAACNAALEMGATEIYVKDAHDSARNLIQEDFPQEVKILRGWSGQGGSMIEGLDSSFDGLIFIGYHSGAGENGNPLSHTINGRLNYLKLNGSLACEASLNAYLAREYGVPLIFVSGDKMLCDKIKKINSNIETVATKEGLGGAVISLSPRKSLEDIGYSVKKAMKKIDKCQLKKLENIKVEMNYKDHKFAYRASHYPGVNLIDGYTVEYFPKDMKEMMTTRMFIM